MRKEIFLFIFLLPLSFANAAKLEYDNFSKYVSKENLKYFTRDIGGLLGAASYGTGRILGWGGFNLSARASFMPKPNAKNDALGYKEGRLLFPWIQGEIGMPFRLDGFIRAGSFDGLTVAGGGLKWSIIPPREILYTFQSMLVVMGQSGVHRDFSVATGNAALAFSFKLPYVAPYLGGGVDYTKVRVESAADNEVADITGLSRKTLTPRGTLGLNFSLPAYLDLSLAGHYASYGLGAEASFGLRF